MEDLDTYSAPINEVNVTTNNLLERGLMEKREFEKVHEGTGALRERQRRLRNICRENGDR